MARILIVGCGCRGQSLARALIESGHPVRGTTREAARRAEIESTGAEAVIADPYRLATVMPHIAGIGAVCWLMGSANGDDAAALHGTRLQTMLERLVDTMVRGLIYEAAGTVDAGMLRAGSDAVRDASARWHMPTAVVDTDPSDHGAWLAAMIAAVEGVLAA